MNEYEGSINEAIAKRIKDVILEHYEETTATVIDIHVSHVLDDRIFIVQPVIAWEGDDDYTIHTETVRVDVKDDVLHFNMLTENDLQLKDEL